MRGCCVKSKHHELLWRMLQGAVSVTNACLLGWMESGTGTLCQALQPSLAWCSMMQHVAVRLMLS